MSELRLPASRGDIRSEIEIKRSTFITILRRVASADEARDLLADARAEFPDARHHCSAYVVSQVGAQPLQHSSDDGEPSGTAGRPMLDVLTGHSLTDTAAVVVRYFGGTLLGTGGLVRAYTDSVRTALEGEELVEQIVDERRRLSLSHADAGRIEAELRARGYEIVSVDYLSTRVELDVAVHDVDRFEVDLAALTSGAVRSQPAGHVISEVPAHAQ